MNADVDEFDVVSASFQSLPGKNDPDGLPVRSAPRPAVGWKTMSTITKMPSLCSAAEIEAFRELVGRGKEVTAEGLDDRIKAARALVFHSLQGQVIGVAALKTPAAARRQKVFHKAQAPQDPDDYPFEAGWLFVSPAHRGKGLSRELLGAILESAQGRGVFATTRSENGPMRRTLERFGFVETGNSYPSERGEYTLCLFLRPGGEHE